MELNSPLSGDHSTFQIKDGKIFYSSRYLESKAFAKAVQSDTECKIDLEKAKNIQDAAVSVAKYNKSYVALTEVPLPVRFDLETLETLGNFEFQDELPKSDIFESAHPHYFEDTKEIFNFLTEYGLKTHYVLYKMVENSERREVIARIPVSEPGYIHSFAMTENYLVLVEFPLVVKPLRLATANPKTFASYISLFNWIPQQGTRFMVVEKATGKLVLDKKSEALFSFHHANAYEEGNKIIVDLTAHNFTKLELVFPQSKGSLETVQGLLRFHLTVDEQKLSYENLLDAKVEFPKIPDRLDGKPYRYLYLINFDNHSLVKYDFKQKKTSSWIAENTTLIEPIFVPAPQAKSEDEGVLLTIAHDQSAQSSYLLVLDAQHLNEIARAILPNDFPTSFHGQFF